MIHRQGGSLAAALEDDDMLGEILLRLPPWPSSLPCASTVCKRWRGLLTDPGFLRRFGAHHWEPPLIGVFLEDGNQLEFTPLLPAPDRIPPRRFDLPVRDVDSHTWAQLHGCRHGRILVLRQARAEVLVFNPITGDQRHVPIPSEFKIGHIIGTVICAAHNKGHVNAIATPLPLRWSFYIHRTKDHRPLASVYSSETDTWDDIISTEGPCLNCSSGYLSTFVGSVLYWTLMYAKDGILGFDLDRQSLDVLKGPSGMNHCNSHQINQAEDGAVGLVMSSHHYCSIQMWERKVNLNGVPTWVLRRTVETDNILGLPPLIEGEMARGKLILGYVEDTDEIVLYLKNSVYLVQLKSTQGGRPLMAMEPANS